LTAPEPVSALGGAANFLLPMPRAPMTAIVVGFLTDYVSSSAAG
jgi:hypothetical protein